MPLLGNKSDIIKKSYSASAREDVLWRIYDKQFSIKKFLKRHYTAVDREEPIQAKTLKKSKVSHMQGIINSVIVDYDKKLAFVKDPECDPTLDDKIIAKSDKNGIKIHTI